MLLKWHYNVVEGYSWPRWSIVRFVFADICHNTNSNFIIDYTSFHSINEFFDLFEYYIDQKHCTPYVAFINAIVKVISHLCPQTDEGHDYLLNFNTLFNKYKVETKTSTDFNPPNSIAHNVAYNYYTSFTVHRDLPIEYTPFAPIHNTDSTSDEFICEMNEDILKHSSNEEDYKENQTNNDNISIQNMEGGF